MDLWDVHYKSTNNEGSIDMMQVPFIFVRVKITRLLPQVLYMLSQTNLLLECCAQRPSHHISEMCFKAVLGPCTPIQAMDKHYE